MLTAISPIDRLLFHLWNRLGQEKYLEESEKIQVQVENASRLRVLCGDKILAAATYSIAEQLLKDSQYRGIKIGVYVGSNCRKQTIYGTAPADVFLMEENFRHQETSSMVATTTSVITPLQFDLDVQAIFNLIDPRNCAFIHSTDASRGYPILAYQASYSIERLNKPHEDLSRGDFSVRDFDEPIASSRAQAIERAILEGSAKEPYQMEWNGTVWKFVNWAQRLSDDHVLVQVVDLDYWQHGYWEARPVKAN